MSEQWKGLHYHDRHVTAAPLGRTIVVCELGMACREVCSEAYPCKCCLQAEVEVLRYKRDADRDERMQLRDELDKARAQVQRVRDLCQESGPGWIEWLMPGVATTHIAHVSEDGYIYLPGGEGTDDFLLASARGRSWRLLSVVDIARAIDGGAE